MAQHARSVSQLQKAITTIRVVARMSSKKDKIARLRNQYGDTNYLKTILLYTYDPYRTYRIKNVEMPATFAKEKRDIMPALIELLDQLASHIMGTNEAKAKIAALLSKCTKRNAKLVAKIIARDLRAGIDVAMINIAFPGLIPTFSVQLAKPLDSWDRITFPVIVDEKIDGIRCVAIYDGYRKTRFFSRNGFEFESGMDAFNEEIWRLLPGIPLMFDGEFRAFKFNPDDPVCQKHRDGNWAFEYAKAISRRKEIDPEEIRKYFKLYIWDVVDAEYFTSQGQKGRKTTLGDRKMELTSMFHRHGHEFKNIEMVENYLMHSPVDIRRYMAELKMLRKEGCMIKPLNSYYGFGRSYDVMKLKHFVEGDFRILDAFEGEAGKKYQGKLGGVIIGTDDGLVKSKMGTGFSDEDRLELWLEHLKGRLAGRIVEVQLKDVTADGSLQLPSLIRFRDDKNTTDTLADLKEKLAGMSEEEE